MGRGEGENGEWRMENGEGGGVGAVRGLGEQSVEELEGRLAVGRMLLRSLAEDGEDARVAEAIRRLEGQVREIEEELGRREAEEQGGRGAEEQGSGGEGEEGPRPIVIGMRPVRLRVKRLN